MTTITYDFTASKTESPFEGYKSAKKLNSAIAEHGAKVTLDKNWLVLTVGLYTTKLYNVSLKSCVANVDYDVVDTLTATGNDEYWGYDDCIKTITLPIKKDGKHYKSESHTYSLRGNTGCTHAFLYTLTQITIEAIKAFNCLPDEEVIEYTLSKAV